MVFKDLDLEFKCMSCGMPYGRSLGELEEGVPLKCPFCLGHSLEIRGEGELVELPAGCACDEPEHAGLDPIAAAFMQSKIKL